MNRKGYMLMRYFFTTILIMSVYGIGFTQEKSGKLKIFFLLTANQKKIVFKDSLYINSFNETYKISKLKYYVSSFNLGNSAVKMNHEKYFLVSAGNIENAILFESVPTNSYSTLSFCLGIDSIDNCTGAQTGSLDPINDMFWTWNSGYVYFKLEGNSQSSPADMNRIEYHIGGYKNENIAKRKINVNMRSVDTLLSPLKIMPDKTTDVFIELNLDNLWNYASDLKISETPICVSPGETAMLIADNFESLFSIKNIIVH